MSSLQNIDLKKAYQLLKIPFLSPIDEVVLAHQALIKYYNSTEFQQTEPLENVDLAIQQVNKAFKYITSTFKVEYSQYYENIFEFPFNVLDVRDGSVRKLSIVSISTLGSSTSDTISVRSVKNSSKEKSSNTQINNSIVIENSNVNMGNVNIINSNEERTMEILNEIKRKLEDTLPNVPNKNGEKKILVDFSNVCREMGMLRDDCINQCIPTGNILAGGTVHLKVSKKVSDSSGIEKNEDKIFRFEIEQGTANCTGAFIPVECYSFLGESGQMKTLDEDFLIGNVMSNERLEHPDRRVWPTLNPQDRSHLLKLSVNCLLAQNSHDVIQSVRSQCGVCSDVYYYEVYLFSGGSMRIGWATKQTDLNGRAIGEDRYSIALDGSSDRHRIFHQRTNLSVNQSSSSFFNFTPKPKTRWLEDDVVGCLIDFNRKIFNFYVNGKLVKYNNKKVHFEDDQSYYAAVSLTDRQMCYFNFGQAPFKYTQVDVVEFKTICQNFGDYQLLELYFPYGSFKEILANSQVDVFFNDPKQKDMDIWARKMDQNIIDNITVANPSKISEKMRIIQAIIEVGGRRFQYNRFDVHASWISQLITQSTSENPEFPHYVFQLLYPYFKLHLTNDTATKHRNVCIILASLITVMNDFKVRVNLYELVLTYLTEIISNCGQIIDECLLLFATVCLTNLDLDEKAKIVLQSNAAVCNIINTKKNLNAKFKDFNSFPLESNSSLVQQLTLLSQWTFDNLLICDQTNLHAAQNNHETLDPSNCGEHIKLSPDLLSARSDRAWQSVRSITYPSLRRYHDNVYYEATLITSGPIRIGWASENVQMCSSILGEDQYSIGFDGHSRCIWHRGKQYPVSNVQAQWMVGDVVGCMVLPKQKRFAFYLNKEPIHLPFFSLSSHYSSGQFYHAAASLFTFQQCQFNFSVAKLPPRRPSFRVIDSLRKSMNEQFINVVLTGSRVVNSWINVAGRIEAGNINITDIPEVDDSTSVNNEDKTIQLQSTSENNNNLHKERRRSV